MATPEGKIKAAGDKMLKAEGVWFFSPQSGPYGTAGIPDRVGIVCGLFLGIEYKADEKRKMTALQERCKKQIEEAGGKFFLVYDKETIEQVRQWIVSTRSSRQAGSGGGVGGPSGHIIRYTHSDASEKQLSDSTAFVRSDDGTTELRVFNPLADPILLHLASSARCS